MMKRRWKVAFYIYILLKVCIADTLEGHYSSPSNRICPTLLSSRACHIMYLCSRLLLDASERFLPIQKTWKQFSTCHDVITENNPLSAPTDCDCDCDLQHRSLCYNQEIIHQKGDFFSLTQNTNCFLFFNELSIKMTHECGCSGWQFYFLCLVQECSFDFIRKRHLPL